MTSAVVACVDATDVLFWVVALGVGCFLDNMLYSMTRG